MDNDILASSEDTSPLVRPAPYWTIMDTLVLAQRQLLRIPRISRLGRVGWTGLLYGWDIHRVSPRAGRHFRQ